MDYCRYLADQVIQYTRQCFDLDRQGSDLIGFEDPEYALLLQRQYGYWRPVDEIVRRAPGIIDAGGIKGLRDLTAQVLEENHESFLMARRNNNQTYNHRFGDNPYLSLNPDLIDQYLRLHKDPSFSKDESETGDSVEMWKHALAQPKDRGNADIPTLDAKTIGEELSQ